jgi:hypothetical protein
LGEPLSTGLVTGGLLILVSVLVTTLRARRHAPPPPLQTREDSTAE